MRAPESAALPPADAPAARRPIRSARRDLPRWAPALSLTWIAGAMTTGAAVRDPLLVALLKARARARLPLFFSLALTVDARMRAT
jgi:hypothetical protein